jgi:hypothetical protein
LFNYFGQNGHITDSLKIGTIFPVFIIGKDNLSSKLTIDSQDYIVFDLDSYQDVMYYRYTCINVVIA